MTAHPRLRVVVVVLGLPWPPRGGVDLRIRQLVDSLDTLAEVGVAALSPSEGDVDPAPAAVLARAPQARRLDPREQTIAGLQWLKDPAGLPSDRWWTAEASATVEEVIAATRPHVVVLGQLWTRRALDAGRRAGARVVLDAHNVEGALHAEMADAADAAGPAAILARRTHEAEGALVAQVDQVWACSAVDGRELTSRYPGCAPVRVVPNAVDVPPLAPSPAADSDSQSLSLLFPGSFRYPPNVRASLWLLQEVLPLLRDQGFEDRLVLAGSGPPPELVQAASRQPDVEVTGPVQDAGPYFRAADAVVVPLFEGGGTRFKVLEAFAAGTPVVSTRKGIEGIDAAPDRDYLAAESASDFANAVNRLRADPGLSAALAANAHDLVERHYSSAALTETIGAALRDLGEAGETPGSGG